jgi:hypothetical protein
VISYLLYRGSTKEQEAKRGGDERWQAQLF